MFIYNFMTVASVIRIILIRTVNKLKNAVNVYFNIFILTVLVIDFIAFLQHAL